MPKPAKLYGVLSLKTVSIFDKMTALAVIYYPDVVEHFQSQLKKLVKRSN